MLALGAVAARATHCLLIRFEPGRVLDTVERERCTILETVPTTLTALLERQREREADLSSLRLVGTSGSPTPARLGWACCAEWGVPLRILYSATELSPTVTGTALEEPGDLGHTTVGRPLPWTELRVVDPGTCEPVGLCEPGVVQVRGYMVMAGYRDNPEATAAAIDPEGWFTTGDLGTLDTHAYLRITGRAKDVIIRGGENLYPAEIETLIQSHPAVRDAAVVGVPDDYYGEQACAVVQLKDGETLGREELTTFLRQRTTHQKVPHYVEFAESFPQTASGKVQKNLLRADVRQELGVSHETEDRDQP